MVNFELSALSQDELKVLAAQAIRLIQNPEQGIGTELFDAIITVVPQSALEAVVVDDITNPQKIYLTWRRDERYHGWHCPGTFLRFGEDFEDALRRLLKHEIQTNCRIVWCTKEQYSFADRRGHTVGIVFLVQPDGEPNGGEWFPIHQLPNSILLHHDHFIKRVLAEYAEE